jgi:hypothetical protein
MLSVRPYTQPETSHRARIGGAIARVTVRWSIASVTLTARETASRAASEVESSAMPAPKISPSDYPELVRLHVREQWSHARLGQHFGCHPSVVTRTLKRVPVVELADAEHRKEAAARRAREYRDRQAEKAASPEALAEKLTGHPVDSADHLTIKTPRGDRIMFRSKKNGLWYREGVCGPVRAKRSDFEGKVPADFEQAPRYGADPVNYPREKLGTFTKMVRMQPPVGTRERDVLQQVSPIPEHEQAARHAEGWELVS